MRPGVRVVRGPDWRHGEEDGGQGFLGTVINIYPNNTVKVQWDIGTETVCRAGQENAFDLRIYDNAALGLKQVHCDGKCLDTDDNYVYGMRWKCLVCDDRDNCTPCYMSEYCTDCVGHPFARYLSPFSTVVRVVPRSRSRKRPLNGIFPGARVVKYKKGLDSKDEKVGTVRELADLQPDARRSAVRVAWDGETPKTGNDGEPELPVYRVGADGKAELKLLVPASPGSVFMDHLPVLDLTMPMDVELNEGDKVRIDQNMDTVKHLVSEYGGWDPNIEKVLGEEGQVTAILDNARRIASVKFKNGIHIKAMYMNILTKISAICAGDIVRVIRDNEKMRKLQSGHGGWRDAYVSILGEQGRVLRIDDSKDAIVEVCRNTFVLNPDCLVFVRRGETSYSDNPVQSEFSSTKEQLTVPLIPTRSLKPALCPGYSVDIGVRVVRGPDWSEDFGNQDGGEGTVGTVTEICGVREADTTYPKDCVMVVWDTGEKNVYRAGYDKAADLRVYDNAAIGVKHNVMCSVCHVERIFGFLWQCAECDDVSLCSDCYNTDKHDINHVFERFESVGMDEGTRVPKRRTSKRIMAKGIFEGCKVRRGPDWRWKDQDGGEDKVGDVIALVNFCPDTDRDAAEVTWSNGYTNVYRLGYRGRLDLVCVEPQKAVPYYKDHIPILRLNSDAVIASITPASEPKSSPVSTPTQQQLQQQQPMTSDAMGAEAARFREGDQVKITIDVDVLKAIEDNRGSWNQRMADCIGLTGTVIMAKDNDITVDFASAGRWTFHESVLNKIRQFQVGEVVKVQDSMATVKRLQTDSPGWNDSMVKVIGKKGTIEEIDEDGDVRVSFGEYTWVLNPECLLPTTGSADVIYHDDTRQPPRKDVVRSAPSPSPAATENVNQDLFIKIEAGDADGVRALVTKDPMLLLMEVEGKYAMHEACSYGKIRVIQELFKAASKEALLELQDSEGITPLLAAVRGTSVETVEYLVNEGANKDAVNKNKQSAVHIVMSAKNEDKVPMLRALKRLHFSINLEDMLSQTPLFDTILNGKDAELDEILSWPGLKVDGVDSLGFTPFLLACRKGSLKAMQAIIRLEPGQLTYKKRDGYTGLHLAAMNGWVDVVKYLLGQNVDVNAVTTEQKTALHLACEEAKVDIVKFLLENGSDCKLLDSKKKNCLHLCLEAAAEFIEDETSDSPVDRDAVLDVVKELLEAGLSADDKDADGKRPVDYLDSPDDQLTVDYKDLINSLRPADDASQLIGKGGWKTGDFSRTEHPVRGGDKAAGIGTQSLRASPLKGTSGQLLQDQDSNTPASRSPKGQRREGQKNTSSKTSAPLIISNDDHGDHGDDNEEETVVSDPGVDEDSDLCQSCQEEPIRYQLEPCKHMLCGECIPRKRQKKKTCAVCAIVVAEVTETHHQ